jgi:hypothetical protein
MSFEKLNLISKPYEHWYFYGDALNLGIISPIFEAIPKNALSRKEFLLRIKVLFSMTKQKGGMRKWEYG